MTSYSIIDFIFFNDRLYFDSTVDKVSPVSSAISLCFKPFIICNTTIVISSSPRIPKAVSKSILFSTFLVSSRHSFGNIVFHLSKINTSVFSIFSHKIQILIFRNGAHPGHWGSLFLI